MGRLLLILICCSASVFGQSISGYVRDSLTGENLIGAYVYTSDTKVVSITNEYGFFSLKLSNNQHLPITIETSYVGYNKQSIVIDTVTKLNILFQLSPNNILQTIIITGDSKLKKEIGLQEMSIQQIKTLPMLGGEINIMRSMQLLPGVGAGSEGKSDLYVRGGGPDQNLILLDDIPLYYINHLGGFVSVFDAEAISGFSFYKGSFPAKYGSRLSSVIDVHMKDGNMKEAHTNGAIGILSSRICTEGPIKKDTSSYMISLRRSFYDFVTIPYARITKNDKLFAYSFYDLHAKYNYIFSSKNRIYISFFRGFDNMRQKNNNVQDDIMYKNNSSLKWGNMLGAIRLNHSFNHFIFANFTAYYSQYSYQNNYDTHIKYNNKESQETFNYLNQIQDIGFKSDIEIYKGNLHVKIGSQNMYHQFIPNQVSETKSGTENYDTSYNSNKYGAFENVLYIDNSYHFLKNFDMRFGLRGTKYSIDKTTFQNLEPRFLASFTIPNILIIKLYSGTSHQYVHFLPSPSYVSIGADAWMPATSFAPPESSQITSIGLSHLIKKYGIELSLEGYYKEMQNLIEYTEGKSYYYNLKEHWEDYIETNGEGRSKGIECMVHKKEGKFNGWVSYTLSHTTRQFSNINQGRSYVYDFDAKHNFAVVMNYKYSKKLVLSCSWVYYTGRAFTLPNEAYGVYQIEGNENNEISVFNVETYTEKNNTRMAPYHRLDLNLCYTKEKKSTKRVWNFGIYNAYNRQNAYTYQYKSVDILDKNGFPTGDTKETLFQYSLFPLIPSVSYGFYF